MKEKTIKQVADDMLKKSMYPATTGRYYITNGDNGESVVCRDITNDDVNNVRFTTKRNITKFDTTGELSIDIWGRINLSDSERIEILEKELSSLKEVLLNIGKLKWRGV